MSFKQRNSPIKQSVVSSLANQQNVPTNLMGMPVNTTTPQNIGSGLMGSPVTTNQINTPVQTMQTPINPRGFSNMDSINNMYGQNNPGTFTRTVGQSPFMQMDTDPLTGQPINPLSSQSPTQPLIPDVGSPMSPITPPAGVQQPISPFYDLSK